MRWDNLFDDLTSQLEQELDSESALLASEDERVRIARLPLRDRIVSLVTARAAPAGTLRFTLTNGERLRLDPVNIGQDWVAGVIVNSAQVSAQCVLPFSAIATLELECTHLERSLARGGSASESISARLDFGLVLRDLCRRRCALTLTLAGGTHHGTIDRVGSDHLDLAVHERGAARRERDVERFLIVPRNQVLLLRL